jgi:hypothetical protein
MSNVLPFRRRGENRPRSCFICVLSDQTGAGTRCTLYQELIVSETVAAHDCEHYQEDGDKS